MLRTEIRYAARRNRIVYDFSSRLHFRADYPLPLPRVAVLREKFGSKRSAELAGAKRFVDVFAKESL